MKVTSTIIVYEVNATETKSIPQIQMNIHSHWLQKNLVVLEFPGGKSVTVDREDLQKAMENATNRG